MMRFSKKPGKYETPTEEEKQNARLQWVRVYLLDELVHNSGKILDSQRIGDITANVVEKLKERL